MSERLRNNAIIEPRMENYYVPVEAKKIALIHREYPDGGFSLIAGIALRRIEDNSIEHRDVADMVVCHATVNGGPELKRVAA